MPPYETVQPAIDLPSEAHLVRAAQQGDAAAFDEIVRRYQTYLYRLMLRACHHPQDAEEVASEAFQRAYQHLSQFRQDSRFVTWLGRIATNLCTRRREQEKLTTVPLEDDDPPAGSPFTSPGPTPEQRVMKDELKRIVRAAVAELPEPDRTVLRLRDIEQLSTEEVSTRMGLTVPAVKARLHRARRALRAALNQSLLNGENVPPSH